MLRWLISWTYNDGDDFDIKRERQRRRRKLGPAIAAGITVVLKSSEIKPLTALFLGELIAKLDIQKGVINIVTGEGPVAGNDLISNAKIDKIAFTGGTSAGKYIEKIAAEKLKKVALELAG